MRKTKSRRKMREFNGAMEWNGMEILHIEKKKVAREQRRSAVGPCIHNILDDDGLNPHATNWDF